VSSGVFMAEEVDGLGDTQSGDTNGLYTGTLGDLF
jgi:hypothetical protein